MNAGLSSTPTPRKRSEIPVHVRKLEVDLLTIAGNKFYAPKGAGALYLRRGVELEPLIHGGGHERGFRAGTENAAFAVALGKAAELAEERLPLYAGQVRRLRDRLHDAILAEIKDAVLNGHPEERLPNTLNMSFPRVDSTVLQTLVRERVACSTGCGCHAGKAVPSPTLMAIGRSDGLAAAALRLTLGVETTEAEIDEAASVLTGAVNELRGKTAKAASAAAEPAR